MTDLLPAAYAALEPLCIRLEAILSAYSDGSDGSHDVHHSRRVLRTALKIGEGEGGSADSTILICAAYLHDLVNVPKNHPDRPRASALSAEAARPILVDLGIDGDRIEGACQDADRLEALGAIGIARTFYIAGLMGSGLFDGGDPLATNRPLDDRSFALDHFEVKLYRLAGTMQTEEGRHIAELRTEYMRSFVSQLVDELRG